MLSPSVLFWYVWIREKERDGLLCVFACICVCVCVCMTAHASDYRPEEIILIMWVDSMLCFYGHDNDKSQYVVGCIRSQWKLLNFKLTHTHTHTHTRVRTHIQTCTSLRVHAHTHTHTHTQKWLRLRGYQKNPKYWSTDWYCTDDSFTPVFFPSNI